MIYLKKDNAKQSAYIPKNGEYDGRKTFEDGIKYQQSLIEPIEIIENGIYTNPNGYSPVNVNIPLGTLNITENGIYDAKNGFPVRGGESLGYTFFLKGGGYIFDIPQTEELKVELYYMSGNDSGEFFDNTIRGIFGYWLEDNSFFVAEDANNPNLIFAHINEWESERVELTQNEWHLIGLSNKEFSIDGKIIATIPDGVYKPFNTQYFFVNGIGNLNSNQNYYYPNLGYYNKLKINDVDYKPYYNNTTDEFYYLGNNGEINDIIWKVTNNWINVCNFKDVGFIKVKGFDYIDVDVNGDCPELETLNVTDNGTYEGAFNVVNVDVNTHPNLMDLTINENGIYNPNSYGVDGFGNIDVNVTGEVKLGSFEVSENGTYKPTLPISVFNSDDLYNFTTINTEGVIEIKFKVTDTGWIFGNETCGIYARGGEWVDFYWYGYRNTRNITIGEFNTIILQPYSNSYKMYINGVGSGMIEREWDTTPVNVNIGGGSFDFVYIKYWDNYTKYNNKEIPQLYALPSEDNTIKISQNGGDFVPATNIGGGITEYQLLKEYDGWNEVVVNVPPAKLQQKYVTPTPGNVNSSGYLNYAPDTGFEGMSRISLQMSTYNQMKYDEGYEQGYNEGKAEGGDCPELTELNVTENGTYEGAYNIVNVNVDVPTEGGDCDYQDYRELVLRAKVENAGFVDENTFWNKSKIIHYDDFNNEKTANTIMFIDYDTEGWRGEYVTIVQKVSQAIRIDEGLFTNLEEIYELEIECTAIGENAFKGCTNLTKLVLPYPTTIGENAFKDCTNLKEIEFNIIGNISPSAFDGCPTTGIIKAKDNRFDPSKLPSTLSNWKIVYVEDNEVAGIIDVAKYGIRFGYSKFDKVPDFYDFSNVTDMEQMFVYCRQIKTIPSLDTSKVTNMKRAFEGCTILSTIPHLDTSNVSNMAYMLSECMSLVSLPALNVSSLVMGSSEGIFGYMAMNKLTNMGGLINLKTSLNNDLTLVRCPNLTYESCINILNGLYDFTGNGETPTSSQGQLKVHSNFLTTVGDEISIATNKGWQILA